MSADRLRTLYYTYLNGRCNQSEYEDVKKFLVGMCDASELADVETIASMTELDIKLDSERSKKILDQIFIQRKVINRRRYLNCFKYIAAASTILIGFICLYLIRTPQANHIIYQNTDNIVKRIVLPDQSSVYLKPNASITQISNFDQDDARRVHLEGEAFFAIQKDTKRPFIVNSSQGLIVRVLGTRFYANFGQKNESVVLTEGSINVNTDQDKLTLEPQEMVVYRGKGTPLERQIVDTAFFNAWVDNQIYFREQSLFEVVKQLNEAYPEANLSIKSPFRKLGFTGYLPNNNIEQAITILQQTFANHKLTIIRQE